MTKETTVIVLQGGGALGGYQAGVIEALEDAGRRPDWLAGISIGAINAALVAGNAPVDRVRALRSFWDGVSANVPLDPPSGEGFGRRIFNELSAMATMEFGVPGFFKPRIFPPAVLAPAGSPEAISYYDTAPLRATLMDLVDFDRINSGEQRLSLGAVNIRTGNFVYFDSADRTIGPEHVMASGALPPGFPPVEIDGEFYWDGGLVSNTPLQYVLDSHRGRNPLTVFQVDLFSARGSLPRDLNDVAQREKDIRFSSRTRFNTDVEKQLTALREAAHRLAQHLPDSMKDDPDLQTLLGSPRKGPVAIMHLIYRTREFESQSKDYEFSRATVRGHWEAGKADTLHSLHQPRWLARKPHPSGIETFDFSATAGGTAPSVPTPTTAQKERC